MSREYFDRILRQEIHLASTLNTSKQSSTHKYHGYLSEIHLSNASKQLEIQQLYNLRKRLDSISDPINEHIRVNYMRNKDITMRNNQQKQCQSLNILIKMIHKKVQQLGYDYRKVSIGGYPDGLFEKMFKIQPSKYMSKAQFVTVMRSVFTLDMNIKTEQSIEMIYNTFDYENKNQLDWRAFLYQLALIIHAYEPVLTHLKMGYAIFSSLGTLVLDSCTEKLQLSTIKDIIEVPIVYSSRSAIRSLIDDCWFELTQNDLEAMEIAHAKNAPSDADELWLTFNVFNKLIQQTTFKVNLEGAKVFGKRDQRIHLYVLEDNYYHPNIVQIIITLRREIRCDNEADLFIERSNYRSKFTTLYLWKEYRRRRDLCRRVAVDMFVHWCHAKQSIFFDHWKKIILLEKYTETIQRYSRGYLGKLRKYFMRKLNQKSIILQSFHRKNQQYKSYHQQVSRRLYSILLIQKIYRGYRGRKRMKYHVEAYYDREIRKLTINKSNYYHERRMNAAKKIQFFIKKFLKKMKSYRKHQQRLALQRIEEEIILHKKDNLRKAKEYKYELEEWFKRRKEEYDRDRMIESHTTEQRNKIIAYRKRKELYEKERKELERIEKNEKLEEKYIEQWNEMWEKKKIERCEAYKRECRQALFNPETPSQRILKKSLEIKIQKRIPEVLRKADRMRIPMEIPEAKEIAIEDVIDMEGKEEIERVIQEMYQAAKEIEKQKELKALEDEKINQKRKERLKSWAAVKIQTQVRMMFSRAKLREKAYKRYRKEFDPITKAYYYINLVTNQTSWNKPTSLGAYDIDTKDHWVAMKDTEGDAYYYNPCTWKMTWNQPKGTIFCCKCHQNGFAIARLENNKQFYCDEHLQEIAHELLTKEHVLPQNIQFKSFDCSINGANKTYWASIPTENWLVYTIQSKDKLVRTQSMNEKYFEDDITFNKDEEDEEDEKRQEEEYNPDMIYYCKRCETFVAEMKCYTCDAYYCKKCYDRKHKSPPWNTHTYKEIIQNNHGNSNGNGNSNGE